MRLTTSPSSLAGRVRIPASKSHTVRAALLALLADGQSVIRHPLDSADTRSALAIAEGLGATVERDATEWRVTGVGGAEGIRADGQTLDVGNSGTTLYLALSIAALAKGEVVFDGDAQIRRRSAANLLDALRDLGVGISDSGKGCCPISVRGPLSGGSTSIECPTSQYLSSLLIACPLASQATHLDVPLLYEQPYVTMTLRWLEELGVAVASDPEYRRFDIPGGQGIRAFDRAMPADWSSAAFFLCAAAVTGSDLVLEGLDRYDVQGDKAIVQHLQAMGAEIGPTSGGIRVRGPQGGRLRAAELDLNATPDALPALAVTAAFAEGTTLLGNVPQARMKETDRIAVMAQELSKLGVSVKERPDGLEVTGGRVRGGEVHGHGDHRVVMAMAVAGLAADGPVTVDTAETAGITFPEFPALLRSLGAEVIEGD